MNRLKAHLLSLPVPGGWGELSQAQYVGVAEALYNCADQVELKARITWRLLNVSLRTPRRLAAILFGLSPLDRHQLTTLADPFLKPDALTGTPLLVLHAGKTNLYCAHADLINQVDAYVWGLVDTAFMKYNKTKDVELLRAMAMALYAPAGASRSDRINGVHAPLMDLVPMEELMALHLMWSGHRLKMVDHAPWVFRSANQKKATRRKTGWTDVLLSLSGGKFGAYAEVSMTPAKVFLRELSHQIEESVARKNKAEADKQRARR